MEQIDDNPRIVHVISDAGPHPYFRTLIEAGGLDRRRHTVGTVGSSGALQDAMHQLGVKTFALGAESPASFPIAAYRLARLLRAWQADLVQTHLVNGSLVGLAAARLARGPVAVMTAHHSHELPFHGLKLQLPERLCAGPMSDRIIAPSHQVAEVLERYACISERKISVIHHGFDLNRLDPSKVDPGTVRRELGLEGKLVFGAIGRIFKLKNYAALVRAFVRALGSIPDAHLIIVGAGDVAPLQKLAEDLGAESHVTLAGLRADIPELLAAFDVFIHPAIAESFGMVIIEAMAMAKPLASTPVGIAPEVLSDGAGGCLMRDASENALIDGFHELMRRRAEWSRMGVHARGIAQQFSATRMAAEHDALYRSCIRDLGH